MAEPQCIGFPRWLDSDSTCRSPVEPFAPTGLITYSEGYPAPAHRRPTPHRNEFGFDAVGNQVVRLDELQNPSYFTSTGFGG